MNECYSNALADLDVVARKAEELLYVGGVARPPVPSNLIALCDASRPVVVKERDIGVVKGAVKNVDGKWVILVNSRLCNGAKRFSLFHEGYHILARIGAVPQRGPREYAEWLADAFAARILMPHWWVVEAAKKANDLNQICAWFRVSQAAMSRRLNELQVTLGVTAKRRPWG